MNPRPSLAGRRRRWVLNPQLRQEWAWFLQDGGARRRTFRSALVVGAVLLLAWPGDRVLKLNGGPITYLAAGWATLAIGLYLALIQGIRYRAGGGAHSLQEWAALVPLSPQRYLLGSLPGRMADLLLFLLIVAPLLIAAAALEGSGPDRVGAGMAVLLLAALVGRLAAMVLQLYLEHRPGWMIAAAHIALLVILLGAGAAWPPLSPLAAFLGSASGAPAGLLQCLVSPWPGMVALYGAAALALYGLALLRVRRLRARGGAPPAGD